LRPAQDLVRESSKFSLRHFFESQSVQTPAELTTGALSYPKSGAADVPLHNPPSFKQAPGDWAPQPTLNTPTVLLNPPPVEVEGAKDGKFTFTGMMSTTTPIQRQHEILKKRQEEAVGKAIGETPKPPALISDPSIHVLRLKEESASLKEQLSQVKANLASTAEGLVRGNKALSTERAQFNSKYKQLTAKLEAANASLFEVSALHREGSENATAMRAKVSDLQKENAVLVATRAEMERLVEESRAASAAASASASAAASASASAAATTAASAAVEAAVSDEQTVAQLRIEHEKFTTLSAQHSLLLDEHRMLLNKKSELEQAFNEKSALLETTEAEVGAANDHIDHIESEAARFKEQLESAHLQIANTDSLIDTLDARLATERAQVVPEPAPAPEPAPEPAPAPEPVMSTAGCCPKTARCDEMCKVAKAAQQKMNGASAHECKQLHEEWQFLDALAKRASDALVTGDSERVMVGHVFTDPKTTDASTATFDLSSHIRTNRIPMARTFDETFANYTADMHAHTTTTTGTNQTPTTTEESTMRTNSFVQAVSKDLKFSMDGSQALYASSSTTGLALRV
jgi:hypothetical protein